MLPQKITPIILLASIVMLGSACKTFEVQDVNYAHEIETVLIPNEEGEVSDVRHGLTFNVAPFQKEEFGENDSTEIKEVRLIRDASGYYFITASQFKNVYVMQSGNGKLKLKKKIKVSEDRLAAPALNLRNGIVELVKTETNETLSLNKDGIQEDKNEEQS